MKNLKDTIQELENTARNPESAVRNAMNATGKKACLLYTSRCV